MQYFSFCIAFAVVSYSSSAVSANVATFGDWGVLRSSDGKDLIAGTVNQAGNFIGFRCFSATKECVHALGADIICDNGDKYPILINSSTASLSMEAICSKNDKTHELLLTKYDDIHEILIKGGSVGFAIPMENGNFKAVRFSLDGSQKAIKLVEDATSKLDDGESYF
jgi:hypothetical protein